MTIGYATYSPDDNKLRLYPFHRLSPEDYARVKAHGFRWAPRQELFVAPTWTPDREDLLIEFCGEVEDEDKSLTERAEERAERFEEYHEKRTTDARRASAAADEYAKPFANGQPILVWHHSEKRARKDQERCHNAMRRAVKAWDTAAYWTERAAGALAHAKYKERPDVRARRIKKLEADLRKVTRYGYPRWIEHYTNRLAYERAMLGQSGYIEPPKRVGRAAVPLLNYGGEVTWKRFSREAKEEAIGMTKAQFAAISKDYRGTALTPDGTHRIRIAIALAIPGLLCKDWNERHSFRAVYLTDAKINTKPGAGRIETREQQETAARIARGLAELETNAAKRAAVRAHNKAIIQRDATPRAPVAQAPAEVEAMRDVLKNGGAEVVVADQLFPTPPELARRMVELANIEPGMCVLEPSAGTGNIVREVVDSVDTEILAYEINPKLCTLLGQTFPSYRLQARCRDFLEVTDFMGCYPRIIMNPPFKDGADIKHILHAAKFLAPGGKLVAICAGGPRQEAALRHLAQTWERLPEGTFAGTNVRTVLLTLREASLPAAVTGRKAQPVVA